jgi:hypothetical protein
MEFSNVLTLLPRRSHIVGKPLESQHSTLKKESVEGTKESFSGNETNPRRMSKILL